MRPTIKLLVLEYSRCPQSRTFAPSHRLLLQWRLTAVHTCSISADQGFETEANGFTESARGAAQTVIPALCTPLKMTEHVQVVAIWPVEASVNNPTQAGEGSFW